LGIDYRDGSEGGEAGGADAGGWAPSLREREEAAARVWGSRLLRETTTVYFYCLIIIEGVQVFK
jgi:hypothetical protein